MDKAIRGLEENLWSFWANFGRCEGAHLHDSPELMWFETPIKALPYNAVMRTRTRDPIEPVMDSLFTHFEAADKPFFWLLHPTMQPRNIADLLEQRGFAEVDVAPGMVANLADVPEPDSLPEGVTIREVTADEDFAVMIDFIVWRWHVPGEWRGFFESMRDVTGVGRPGSGVRAWFAMKDGQALAKAVTMEAHGVIGLYGVATKPEARGMGLGRNICLHAFKETDRSRGLLGVLHSSPMAIGLYKKMGFHEVAPFRLFAVPDSLQL